MELFISFGQLKYYWVGVDYQFCIWTWCFYFTIEKL